MGEIGMAFVNENVSEDDIEQYKLKEMWLRHNSEYRHEGVPSFYQFQWTINRDINVYYMPLSTRGGEVNFIDSVLYWDGTEVEVRLQLAEGSSPKFDDNPFYRIWNLLGFTPEKLPAIDPNTIIDLLKAAIITYGYSGARKQIPNTVVKFNF